MTTLAGSASGRQVGVVDMHFTATPVPLDPTDRARTRVGALRYLGGWVLRGRDSRFGGFSSLVLDGDRFLSISDTGSLIRFSFNGRTLRSTIVGELPACPGHCDTKLERDAESTTRAPDDSAIWVGYENSNEIWRYDDAMSHSTGHVAPVAMHKWPLNLGAESLIRLRDGRFLVVGENRNGPPAGTHPLLLFAGDPIDHPAPTVIAAYRSPAGFDPSDATELPDGRILLLNRRVTLADGFVSAITVFDPKEIASGKVIEGQEIARLDPPLTVDNMEGVTSEVVNGRTILWMISDDNFMPFERTLLLKFAIDEPKVPLTR